MTQTDNTATILIVDDNPVNLEMLFQYFAHSALKTLVAQDGESALLQLEQIHPDLILLDVLMPGIDGFETCRQLKANESTQDIPVIFMTALSATADKVKGFVAVHGNSLKIKKCQIIIDTIFLLQIPRPHG
jgi:CheY-like chemotaxis protein